MAVESISLIAQKWFLFLVIMAYLLFTIACGDRDRFNSIEASVLLIDNIRSYQSIETFKASLESAYSWEMLSSDRSDFNGDSYRPPFQIESLLVRDFVHLGYTGNLQIVFFNNRLAQVLFFPSQSDEYLITLSSKLGREVVVEPFLVSTHLRIWATTDYRGRRYIGWEDERLADEMTEWIKKYA